MIRKLIALTLVLAAFSLAGCAGPQTREVIGREPARHPGRASRPFGGLGFACSATWGHC